MPVSGGNFSALGVGFEFPSGVFENEAEIQVSAVQVSNCKVESPAAGNTSKDIWIITLGVMVLILVVVIILVIVVKEKNRDFFN